MLIQFYEGSLIVLLEFVVLVCHLLLCLLILQPNQSHL